MFNRDSVSSVLGLVMAAGLALFAIVIVLAMYVGGATSSVIYTAVILGFIVSFVVGFGFANKVITGRLREALRSVTAISNGNYNFEMEDLGADEIGQIAVKLGETQRKYRRIFEDLTGFIDTAIKTSHQLSQAKSRADQGVRRQEMDTERLQAAVSELSGSVEEVATHASTAAQSAQEADTEADNGKSVVNFTRESISALAKHVQVAADVINKLEEHSNSIGTILDVIRGIAEQTNLLALNAAIEAARAGEQGRGFAVVADEVRTLAQRTQESTQEIQSMIEKLQAGSKEAVEAMNRGREGAENCLDQATKAGLALEQITNAVGKINEMNMQIAAAAKEQSKATDAITENVSNIRETTHSTVEVNNLTAVASDELEALAANLKKFMQQNRM